MFISSSIWILLKGILSNILDILGKRPIGLYDVTLFGGLPGLWIMIIWANVDSFEKDSFKYFGHDG